MIVRLWTVHPKYLDPQGLVALWREALLAQKVLRGLTVGYKSHPQLVRFRAQPDPAGAVAGYLAAVQEEAARRGYRFDKSKIVRGRLSGKMKETAGQLTYEWKHLRRKLRKRSPARFRAIIGITKPVPHPSFRIKPGPVRDWERVR